MPCPSRTATSPVDVSRERATPTLQPRPLPCSVILSAEGVVLVETEFLPQRGRVGGPIKRVALQPGSPGEKHLFKERVNAGEAVSLNVIYSSPCPIFLP